MRDQKIPVIAFVANTGGLLGLCMGFSLVSVFEILYHALGALKRIVAVPRRQDKSCHGRDSYSEYERNKERAMNMKSCCHMTSLCLILNY